jgi:hypothetical protein
MSWPDFTRGVSDDMVRVQIRRIDDAMLNARDDKNLSIPRKKAIEDLGSLCKWIIDKIELSDYRRFFESRRR